MPMNVLAVLTVLKFAIQNISAIKNPKIKHNESSYKKESIQ
jgi:hypothetical protein